MANENVAVPVVAEAVVRDIVILGGTQLPVTLLVSPSFPLSAAVLSCASALKGMLLWKYREGGKFKALAKARHLKVSTSMSTL